MALSESNYALEFLLSEAPGGLSRDEGVLLTGQNLVAGAVVGEITKAQAAAPIPAIVGTGTGAMTALSLGPDVQVGVYAITLLATSATAAYSVVAPDGTVLPNGAVGTAYVSTHASFLISSAGTMTIGDAYALTVTAGGTPAIVGTGTGLMSAISLGPDAQNGGYRINILATSATGEFEVIAPDGTKLRRGQIATAYTSSHINFTIANGGTMTAGDYYNIVVAAGSGKFVAVTPATYDGRHIAAGVIVNTCDATDADQDTVVIARNAEVSSARLGWGTLTTGQQATATAQLAARGILVR